MRRRKINQEYLHSITSTEIKNERMDALSFALSIKEFIDEYLEGLVTAEISGDRPGSVNLNLPAVSYLIRLISMLTDDDEMIDVKISLDDKLTIKAQFKTPLPIEETAHVVEVARLSGFDVDREGNTLFFTAKIHSTYIMQIYALSNKDFKRLLILTYKM